MKNVEQFLNALSDLGVKVYPDGAKLKIRGPRAAMTGELEARIQERKQSILAYLRGRESSAEKPQKSNDGKPQPSSAASTYWERTADEVAAKWDSINQTYGDAPWIKDARQLRRVRMALLDADVEATKAAADHWRQAWLKALLDYLEDRDPIRANAERRAVEAKPEELLEWITNPRVLEWERKIYRLEMRVRASKLVVDDVRFSEKKLTSMLTSREYLLT